MGPNGFNSKKQSTRRRRRRRRRSGDGEEGEGGGAGAAGAAAAGGHAPPRRALRAAPAVVGRPRSAAAAAGARGGGGDGGQPRIGYEAARQLATHGLHVVLTSRDAARGRDAAEQIRAAAGKPGVSVEWRQLDVTDAASVEGFATWVERTHGGVHVLVSAGLTALLALY